MYHSSGKSLTVGSDPVDSHRKTQCVLSHNAHRENPASVQVNVNSSVKVPMKLYHFL